MSLSPALPRPDTTAFEHADTFATKRKRAHRVVCPSPPQKTPPKSRVFRAPHSAPVHLLHPAVAMATATTAPDAGGGDGGSPVSADGDDAEVRRAKQQRRHSDHPQPYLYSQTYFERTFERLGVLGRGSYGEVYRAQCRASGELYAVKKARQRFRGVRDRARALEEVSTVQTLGLVDSQHQHLVQHFDAWEENNFLYLQTELCAHGSLAEFLETHDPIDEARVWDWLLDLLLALEHVHRSGLVHMDVKPANIFLAASTALKLGDFGIAVRAGSLLADVAGGDSVYMPPELLDAPDDAAVTPAIDVFCAGVTFFEVAAHVDLPKSGPLWLALRRGDVRWPDPAAHSDALKQLIAAMLAPAPADRPTPAALLQLPPFAERLAARAAAAAAAAATASAATVAPRLLRSAPADAPVFAVPAPPLFGATPLGMPASARLSGARLSFSCGGGGGGDEATEIDADGDELGGDNEHDNSTNRRPLTRHLFQMAMAQDEPLGDDEDLVESVSPKARLVFD